MGVGGAGISFQAAPIDFRGFSSPEPAKTSWGKSAERLLLPAPCAGTREERDGDGAAKAQGTLPPCFSTWRRLLNTHESKEEAEEQLFLFIGGFLAEHLFGNCEAGFPLWFLPCCEGRMTWRKLQAKVWQREAGTV